MKKRADRQREQTDSKNRQTEDNYRNRERIGSKSGKTNIKDKQ